MIYDWEIQIPSLTGEAKRKAYLYLPKDYEINRERRYPVMYMFDGHNLFSDKEATYGKCWGLKDYLDRTQTPLIVAGVECNHEGNGRLSEYSPTDFIFKNGEGIKGRGKQYMDWLVESFKPFIDENYRTVPDRENTAIGGSSMGGLMTLYALANYGAYFSRGASLSPSLWTEGGKVPSFIQKGKFKDVLLYMDYGSKEFKNHDTQKKVFAQTCAKLIEKDASLTVRIVPEGTHCEASWERSIPFFMRALKFYPEK